MFCGGQHVNSLPERRNLQLTNFIAFWLALCLCSILLFRPFAGTLERWFYLPLIVEAFLLLSIIWLNHIGFNLLARILICWLPAAILIIDLRIVILNVPQPETSHYVGFRIFQIAFSFFPFVVFNLSEKWKMVLAVLVPLLLAVSFDKLLDILGAGYTQMGLSESSYYYNNFRTIISLSVIGASFVFLKSILKGKKQEIQD